MRHHQMAFRKLESFHLTLVNNCYPVDFIQMFLHAMPALKRLVIRGPGLDFPFMQDNKLVCASLDHLEDLTLHNVLWEGEGEEEPAAPGTRPSLLDDQTFKRLKRLDLTNLCRLRQVPSNLREFTLRTDDAQNFDFTLFDNLPNLDTFCLDGETDESLTRSLACVPRSARTFEASGRTLRQYFQDPLQYFEPSLLKQKRLREITLKCIESSDGDYRWLSQALEREFSMMGIKFWVINDNSW